VILIFLMITTPTRRHRAADQSAHRGPEKQRSGPHEFTVLVNAQGPVRDNKTAVAFALPSSLQTSSGAPAAALKEPVV